MRRFHILWTRVNLHLNSLTQLQIELPFRPDQRTSTNKIVESAGSMVLKNLIKAHYIVKTSNTKKHLIRGV